jgi:predicted nucleic acid-binding protein
MLYLDSSAIVALVRPEAATAALRAFLARHTTTLPFSSDLARAEVQRAVSSDRPTIGAAALRQLSRLHLVHLTPGLLDEAGALLPGTRLRSLDAIHLTAAKRAGPDLTAVVTYDRRMADAAVSLGLRVESPS